MNARGRSPAGLASARGRFYRLLAAGFSPPAPAAVRRLARAVGGLPPRELALGATPGDGPWSSLAGSLSEWSGRSPPEVAGELMPEYQRLFVGPYRVEAPPYESCYRGPGRAVMGEAAVEVLRSYAEAGVALHPEVRDLPDHIALELEFLAHLAAAEVGHWRRRERSRLAACLEREERFLGEHLLRWIAPFAARVAAATRRPFYPALAAAAAAYATADRGLVSALRETLG